MTVHHTVLTFLQALPTPASIDITGAGIADTVKTFIGNVFIAILAILGAIALFRRRMVEALELAGLAIVAGLFIYAPGLFSGLGTAVENMFTK
ncbi:MAG TPA: hypothetical protein VIA06_11600 [Candidatus Dormibacteraeota bacterium]|jgi:uncharacterized membrane protein|nr:hypothetical protein [Candidatus Dormibacteraeota bacterium]